jgi:hypothetical protein
MAKVKEITNFVSNQRVKRVGIHSKSKTSKLKTSKLYKKRYRGQGK